MRVRKLYIRAVICAILASACLANPAVAGIEEEGLRRIEQTIDLWHTYGPYIDSVADSFVDELKSDEIILLRLLADPDTAEMTRQRTRSLRHELQQIIHQFDASHPVHSPEFLTWDLYGQLSGRVVDGDTQLPLTSVNVRVYNAAGDLIKQDTTDDSGAFFFLQVPAEEPLELMAVENTGQYTIQLYQDVPCPRGYGYGCLPGDGQSVVVPANGHLQDIDFELSHRMIIEGRVISELDGSPINRVWVRLHDADLQEVAGHSTNGNGEFQFSVDVGGRYHLSFRDSEYFTEVYNDVICLSEPCDFSAATPLSGEPHDVISVGDVSLRYKGTISGTMLEMDTGNPLQNFLIMALFDAQTHDFVKFISHAMLDANGAWETEPVNSGSYLVVTMAGGYFSAIHDGVACGNYNVDMCFNRGEKVVHHDAMQNTEGINLRFKKGHRLTGIVYDELGQPVDGPATNTHVQLFDLNGEEITNQRRIGADGSYSIFVVPGDVYAVATSDQYHTQLYDGIMCGNDACDLTQGDVIVIPPDTDVANIDFHLTTLPALHGTVRDSLGNPVENANVNLYLDGETWLLKTAVTDDQGHYELAHVKPGTYRLRASKTDHLTEFYDGLICTDTFLSCLPLATPLLVDTNPNPPAIDFTLPELARIDIEFDSNAGRPISGVFTAVDGAGEVVHSQAVNQASHLLLKLPPGDYRLMFDQGFRHVTHLYGAGNCFVACDVNDAAPISLQFGDDTAILFSLDHFFEITGFLDANSSSNNFVDAQVWVNDQLAQSAEVRGNYSLYVKTDQPFKLKYVFAGLYSYMFDDIHCQDSACDLGDATPIVPSLNAQMSLSVNMNALAALSGTVYTPDGQPLQNHWVDLSGPVNLSVRTNNAGQFNFVGLEPGAYRILARGTTALESMSYGDVPCPNPCTVNNVGQTIDVVIGDDLSGFDIHMLEKGRLTFQPVHWFTGDVASDRMLFFYRADTGLGVANVTTDEEGNASLLLSAGFYGVLAPDDTYDSAYPNVACRNLSINECLGQSQFVEVVNGQELVLDDFVLQSGGAIGGQVRDEVTQLPASGVKLRLINESGQFVQSTESGVDGRYYFHALNEDDRYHVVLEEDKFGHFFTEAYPDVLCAGGVGVGCAPYQMLPLAAIGGQFNDAIDLLLTPRPKLSIQMIETFTQVPLQAKLRIYDENEVLHSSTEYVTSAEVKYLYPGDYYLTAVPIDFDHRRTGYPNAFCSTPAPQTCDETLALLTLTAGQDSELTLSLDMITGISGLVSYSGGVQGISDVNIDVFNMDGSHRAMTTTNSVGGYALKVPVGQYHVATDVPEHLGNVNEVYDDIPCPQGPAIAGQCDVTQGQLLERTSNLTEALRADFELDDLLFANGFE